MRISESTLLLGGIVLALGFTIGYGITLFTDGFHWLRLTAVIVGAGVTATLIEKWVPTLRMPGSAMSVGERSQLAKLGDLTPQSLSVQTLRTLMMVAGITAWSEESGLLRAQLDGYSVYVNPTSPTSIAFTSVFGVKPDVSAESLQDLAKRWNELHELPIASAHPADSAFRFDEAIDISDGIAPLDLVNRLHTYRAAVQGILEADQDNILV